MSFSRYARPWIPTLVFVAVVLCLLLFINYNNGPTKHKKTRQRVLSDPNKAIPRIKTKVLRIGSKLSGNNSWREALPWDIGPQRYLPNFYTYYAFLNESEKLLYRKGNIVYLHVPKSGGTTMAKCFKSMTKKLKRYSHFYGPIGENGINAVMEQLKTQNDTKLQIFSGEYAFYLCDLLGGKPCSYFLMLREPYDRLVSSYSFCKRHSDDGNNFYCSLNANNLTITEWALIQKSFFFRQLIMNEDMCQGHYDDEIDLNALMNIHKGVIKDKLPCWMKVQAILDSKLSKKEQEGLLKFIVDSIEQWFAGVGVLEKMPETLEALNIIYGLPVYPTCSKIHANKAPSKSKKEDEKVKERLMRELKSDPRVREALLPDLHLYKRVEQIVKSQSAARKHVLTGGN